jgi:hypothetical protein
MPHPVGYFSLDANKPLIQEMTSTWGEDLAQMSEADTLWLIARLGHDLWLETDTNEPPSDDVEAVVNRMHELQRWERIALIKALIQ